MGSSMERLRVCVRMAQAGGAAGGVEAMVEARRELRPALQQGSAACGGRLRCARFVHICLVLCAQAA